MSNLIPGSSVGNIFGGGGAQCATPRNPTPAKGVAIAVPFALTATYSLYQLVVDPSNGDAVYLSLTDNNTGNPLPSGGSNEFWHLFETGSIVNLDDLSDVTITNVSNGQVLTWNATDSRWENRPSSGGQNLTAGNGIDITNDVIAVDLNGNSLAASQDGLEVANSGITYGKIDVSGTAGQLLAINAAGNNWEWVDEAAGVVGGAGIAITNDVASVDVASDSGLNFTGTGNSATLQIADDGVTYNRIDVSGSAGQVLKINSTGDNWEWSADNSQDEALGDLSDVTISSPTNKQVLTYDGNGTWSNESLLQFTDVSANDLGGQAGAAKTAFTVVASNAVLGQNECQFIDLSHDGFRVQFRTEDVQDRFDEVNRYMVVSDAASGGNQGIYSIVASAFVTNSNGQTVLYDCSQVLSGADVGGDATVGSTIYFEVTLDTVSLGGLVDVDVSTVAPVEGEVLKYINSEWQNTPLTSVGSAAFTNIDNVSGSTTVFTLIADSATLGENQFKLSNSAADLRKITVRQEDAPIFTNVCTLLFADSGTNNPAGTYNIVTTRATTDGALDVYEVYLSGVVNGDNVLVSSLADGSTVSFSASPHQALDIGQASIIQYLNSSGTPITDAFLQKQLVIFDKNIYEAVDGYDAATTWNNTFNYGIGDNVIHSNTRWIALASNTNSEPTSTNANWADLTPNFFSDYWDDISTDPRTIFTEFPFLNNQSNLFTKTAPSSIAPSAGDFRFGGGTGANALFFGIDTTGTGNFLAWEDLQDVWRAGLFLKVDYLHPTDPLAPNQGTYWYEIELAVFNAGNDANNFKYFELSAPLWSSVDGANPSADIIRNNSGVGVAGFSFDVSAYAPAIFPHELRALEDVTISSPTDGDILVYNNNGWMNRVSYIEVNADNGRPTATGNDAIAIGESADVSGDEAIGIGHSATVEGNGSVAIGRSTITSSDAINSVAIGDAADVQEDHGVAIGNAAQVGNNHTSSIALGDQAGTTTANQMVIGGALTSAGGISDVRVGLSDSDDYMSWGNLTNASFPTKRRVEDFVNGEFVQDFTYTTTPVVTVLTTTAANDNSEVFFTNLANSAYYRLSFVSEDAHLWSYIRITRGSDTGYYKVNHTSPSTVAFVNKIPVVGTNVLNNIPNNTTITLAYTNDHSTGIPEFGDSNPGIVPASGNNSANNILTAEGWIGGSAQTVQLNFSGTYKEGTGQGTFPVSKSMVQGLDPVREFSYNRVGNLIIAEGTIDFKLGSTTTPTGDTTLPEYTQFVFTWDSNNDYNISSAWQGRPIGQIFIRRNPSGETSYGEGRVYAGFAANELVFDISRQGFYSMRYNNIMTFTAMWYT